MFPCGNIEREKSKFYENVPARERNHVVGKPKPPLMCYLRGRYDSARVKRISDRLRRSALKGLVSGES